MSLSRAAISRPVPKRYRRFSSGNLGGQLDLLPLAFPWFSLHAPLGLGRDLLDPGSPGGESFLDLTRGVDPEPPNG